jgi:GNAT superfamily N-acetyltransferase
MNSRLEWNEYNGQRVCCLNVFDYTELIASVSVDCHADHWVINSVYVVPIWRNEGVASRAVSSVLDHARKFPQVRRVCLTSILPPSSSLYPRLGFRTGPSGDRDELEVHLHRAGSRHDKKQSAERKAEACGCDGYHNNLAEIREAKKRKRKR